MKGRGRCGWRIYCALILAAQSREDALLLAFRAIALSLSFVFALIVCTYGVSLLGKPIDRENLGFIFERLMFFLDGL